MIHPRYYLFLCYLLVNSLLLQAQTYPIFEEDFEDNRNNWLLGERAKTDAFIENGVFYFEGKRERYNYSRRIEQGYLRENQDFEIEIRLRQVLGTNRRGYALEWGGTSMENIFHEFWLRNDGSYAIDKFDENMGGFTDYVAWTRSSLIKINDFNILTVRKIKDKVYYFINGAEVFNMYFTGLYGNEVGFITPPLSAIEIDYLKISTLTNAPQPVIPKAAVPNVWVVLVGIANYNQKATNIKNLDFTVNDAIAMKNFYLSSNGGGVPEENIILLTDKQATKENILNTLKDKFFKAQENDLIVFYFAGHGTADDNNELYLIPHVYKEIDDFEFAIHYKEIEKIFMQSKANKKLWIMDACHSGGALAERKGTIQEVWRDLGERDIAVITSSNVGQTSLEASEIKRGVFSYCLTRGLIDEANKADEDKDGFISILELFNYVKVETTEKALELRNHKQTPQIDGKFNIRLPIGEVIKEN